MLASSVPTKFPIPFAANAGGTYIRSIPQTTTTPGAASLDQGFPPITFDQVGAGGIPPSGKDFNGILEQITAWSQWQAAGALVQFDGTFSTEIGGYPAGALLAGTTAGVVWLNLTDNNTNNPDTGGAGWVSLGSNIFWAGTFGGTANALTAAVNAPTLRAGMQVWGIGAALNTGSATLNLNAGGAKTIKAFGQNLSPGMLATGVIAALAYDGTNFELVSATSIVNASVFAVADNTDGTKKVAIDASGISTGQKRTWKSPDKSGTLGMLSDLLPAQFAKLKIQATLDTAVSLTADYLSLVDSSGNVARASAVSVSISTGASGANGIDSGSVASSTWYAVYAIYNPTSGAVAGLLSTSATSPTLPSGYTFAARFGWVRTDSSSHLLRTIQTGRRAAYIVGTNPSTALQMASGASGSPSTPTWTSVAVGNYVPSTAGSINVTGWTASGSNSSMIAAPNNSYGAYNSSSNPPPIALSNTGNTPISLAASASFELESSNIYYAAASSGALYCTGWEDNL